MKHDDDPFAPEANPDREINISRRALFVLPAAFALGSCAATLRLPCTPSQTESRCAMHHCRHFRGDGD